MKKIILYVKSAFFIIILLATIVTGLYLYAYFSPKIDIKTSNKFYLYDNQNSLIYQGSSTSKWVDLENVSKNFINAIVSIEDNSFYKHNGFDYKRIIKAMGENIKEKKIVEGASTISQQYIKNMYLDFDKTWKRKIDEALLTLNLEVHYSKKDILEGYINTINFGQGNFGVENASHYYFNKKAADLTLEEAIILAGIPKNPNNYNPVSNYQQSVNRGKVVAKSMVANNYISFKETKNLFNNDLLIYAKKDENNSQTLLYYQDAVLNELNSINSIPSSLIESGGLKIYTNLDLKAQEGLEKGIKENMKNDDTQVASIMINPQTGKIIALAGGIDYSKSQFNRVTQSKRQVGSTMKPILYYSALENGFTESSTFKSEKTTFLLENKKTYAPSNFNEIYGNKDITMATAVAYSDNIYAIKTHLFLGTESLIETAQKMGIKEQLKNNASLALGTTELNMLDFANAYTTLASGGYEKNLKLINKVEDLNGNILFEEKNNNHLVLNSNYVYILNETLTSTYNSSFINYNKPTAMSLSSMISRKYAVKSGSTGTDFWIVGYNPDLLTITWTGKDDNSEVDTDYSLITKKIWATASENYLKDKNTNWYETPQNVIGVPVNAITGELEKTTSKNSAVFYYIKGTQPQ